MKIQINKSEDGKLLSMAQPMYAEDIVKAMGLDVVNSNSARTPIDAALSKGEEIPLTEEEEEFMADKYEQYGHVVGMLGALALTTRPDLAYAVGQVRQYTAFPRRHHYQALKRIVRYVKETTHFGIVFSWWWSQHYIFLSLSRCPQGVGYRIHQPFTFENSFEFGYSQKNCH